MKGVYDNRVQVNDSIKPVGDGYVFLFTITTVPINGNIYKLRLKNDNTVTFNGDVYEGTAIQMTGWEKNSDGKMPRPSLSLVNPNGIYSGYVRAGYLDYAKIERVKVLYHDLMVGMTPQGTMNFTKEKWRIYQITSLTKEIVTFELRTLMDRFNNVLPGRLYMPPEFKTVSLG